jgi:hypothetical protein
LSISLNLFFREWSLMFGKIVNRCHTKNNKACIACRCPCIRVK